MTGNGATQVRTRAWLRPTGGRRWCRLIGLFLAGVLLVAGCGDDGEVAGQAERSTTTSTAQSTTTTQPPGTDPAAVEPIIRELLGRLDEITDEIVREPSVALNPDAPVLNELREVVTPDEYEARLRVYRESAEAGLVYEPLNADQIASTTLASEISTLDENTVEAFLCVLNTYRAVGANGYGEAKDGLAHPGRVAAVRIDGAWRIQRVDEDDTQVCDPGGSV